MGFIPDPDQEEDFPYDPDDYESEGYQELDIDGAYIIEIFKHLSIEVEEDYVKALIEDLIVGGGINEFAIALDTYGDFFKAPETIKPDLMRGNIFGVVEDAMNYLSEIPGFEGFAGITWQNGIWRIWIGDTI